MEKQIEEMAKCCTYYCNGECCADVTNICDCDLMCEMFGVFVALNNAGYRKEIQGEWKKPSRYSEPICTICKKSPCQYFGMLPPFCPHCGAKMKGAE